MGKVAESRLASEWINSRRRTVSCSNGITRLPAERALEGRLFVTVTGVHSVRHVFAGEWERAGFSVAGIFSTPV